MRNWVQRGGLVEMGAVLTLEHLSMRVINFFQMRWRTLIMALEQTAEQKNKNEGDQTASEAQAGRQSATSRHREVSHYNAGRAYQVRDNSVERDQTVTGHGPV